MLKELVLALSVLVGGCGDCVPSSAVTSASFARPGPPPRAFTVVRSQGELRAAIAAIHVDPPPPSRAVGADPAERLRAEREQLDAFVAATSFRASDVVLVQAGAERARLAGQTTDGARVTLYFVGQCSPCGGGDPGSSEDARVADDAARAERTELVRVPKGARVAIEVCSTSCGTCPTDIP